MREEGGREEGREEGGGKGGGGEGGECSLTGDKDFWSE